MINDDIYYCSNKKIKPHLPLPHLPHLPPLPRCHMIIGIDEESVVHIHHRISLHSSLIPDCVQSNSVCMIVVLVIEAMEQSLKVGIANLDDTVEILLTQTPWIALAVAMDDSGKSVLHVLILQSHHLCLLPMHEQFLKVPCYQAQQHIDQKYSSNIKIMFKQEQLLWLTEFFK